MRSSSQTKGGREGRSLQVDSLTMYPSIISYLEEFRTDLGGLHEVFEKVIRFLENPSDLRGLLADLPAGTWKKAFLSPLPVTTNHPHQQQQAHHPQA
jgi:hypothetical protein